MNFGGCSAIIQIVQEYHRILGPSAQSPAEQDQYINLGERAFPTQIVRHHTRTPKSTYNGGEREGKMQKGGRRREGKKGKKACTNQRRPIRHERFQERG